MLEGGLTPAVLPSYSRYQLAKMQCDDPVLGELYKRWKAGWEPGQLRRMMGLGNATPMASFYWLCALSSN